MFDEMAKADRESGDSALSAYTDHMADQGTEAMEREKAALFATKEGRYLYRIEEALERGLDKVQEIIKNMARARAPVAGMRVPDTAS